MITSPTLYRASEIVRAEEERHKAWLHDTVLQVLEYLATGGYGECVDAQRLMGIAATAADDLRSALDGTEPSSNAPRPGEFAEALYDVVEEARALSTMQIHVDISASLDDIEPVVASEIVAVTREALTNIRKHADATNAIVQCTNGLDGFELCIIDDGIGFDVSSVREGIGIRTSMRGRMARCGGCVTIASAPQRGTVVRINIDRSAVAGAESVA